MSETGQPGQFEKEPNKSPIADTAKAEKVPAYDTKFAGSVSRHFRDVYGPTGAEGDEDVKNYRQEMESSLKRLAHAETADKTQPMEASMALSDLSRVMASTNPDLPANQGEDEATYLGAKKLFMESCAKVFPGTKENMESIGLELKRAGNAIGANESIAHVSVFFTQESLEGKNATDITKLSRENPQELAQQLDVILEHLGRNMGTNAWDTYQRDFEGSADPGELDGVRRGLVAPVEAAYKLQLMRDQLQGQMYDHENVTPAEARAIDDIRQKVDEPEGERETLSAEEQKVIDILAGKIAEEDENKQRAEKSGAAYGRKFAPAVEALRSIHPEDQDFARRVMELTNGIKESSQKILSEGRRSDPELAWHDATVEAYDELSAVEKNAFAKASQQEFARQSQGRKMKFEGL